MTIERIEERAWKAARPSPCTIPYAECDEDHWVDAESVAWRQTEYAMDNSYSIQRPTIFLELYAEKANARVRDTMQRFREGIEAVGKAMMGAIQVPGTQADYVLVNGQTLDAVDSGLEWARNLKKDWTPLVGWRTDFDYSPINKADARQSFEARTAHIWMRERHKLMRYTRANLATMILDMKRVTEAEWGDIMQLKKAQMVDKIIAKKKKEAFENGTYTSR